MRGHAAEFLKNLSLSSGLEIGILGVEIPSWQAPGLVVVLAAALQQQHLVAGPAGSVSVSSVYSSPGLRAAQLQAYSREEHPGA